MTDRAALGFAEGVAREFAFLSDFGYCLVESTPTLVRFENGELYVHVAHGLGSYGVSVAFGSRHVPTYEISLEEIYQATGQGPRPHCMASSPDAVRHCVRFIADIVRSQSAVLTGAPPLDEVDQFRQRLTDYHARKSAKWPWRRRLP